MSIEYIPLTEALKSFIESQLPSLPSDPNSIPSNILTRCLSYIPLANKIHLSQTVSVLKTFYNFERLPD